MRASIRISLALCLGLLATPAWAFTPNGTIVFLSDFGTQDDAVALCKGVMLGRAPGARIVDLTHEVTPYDIREGALYLAEAADTFPAGTVFVGVVDPGVGTARHAVVIETARGQILVVPDNGLGSLAAERQGLVRAWEIRNPAFTRARPSTTFHGRDVFSPAGAVLAAGALNPRDAGPEVKDLVRLALTKPRVLEAGVLVGEVALLDKRYGNVWTNMDRAIVARAFPGARRLRISIGGTPLTLPLVETFGDVAQGEPLAYFNSRENLSFALNQGDFAQTYGVKTGARVVVGAGD